VGLDIALGPPAGFRDWTKEQWDSYFAQAEDTDGDKLGSYTAVACTVETIRMNLEAGELGSRFPSFMRISQLEGGWYWAELDTLLSEIHAVRVALATLPLDRAVVMFDGVSPHPATLEELAELQRDFRRYYPDLPLGNLADFNHHLLETLEAYAQRAKAQQRGLILS
jgi:Immunity protein 70